MNSASKHIKLLKAAAAFAIPAIIAALLFSNFYGCIYVYEFLSKPSESAQSQSTPSARPSPSASPTLAADPPNPVRALYSEFSAAANVLLDEFSSLCEQTGGREEIDALLGMYDHICAVTMPNACLGALYYLDGAYVGALSGSEAGSGEIRKDDDGFVLTYSYVDGSALEGTLRDLTLELSYTDANQERSFDIIIRRYSDSSWTSVMRSGDEISAMRIDGSRLDVYYSSSPATAADIRDFDALTASVALYFSFYDGRITFS